jgi:hypothetical protein
VVPDSGRSSFPPKSKRAITDLVMALWSKLAAGRLLATSPRCRRQVNADADKDEGGRRQEHDPSIIARGLPGRKRRRRGNSFSRLRC